MVYLVYAIFGVCYIWCMLYLVYAVFGVCCIGVCCIWCTLYLNYGGCHVCCTQCQPTIMVLPAREGFLNIMSFNNGRVGDEEDI